MKPMVVNFECCEHYKDIVTFNKKPGCDIKKQKIMQKIGKKRPDSCLRITGFEF